MLRSLGLAAALLALGSMTPVFAAGDRTGGIRNESACSPTSSAGDCWSSVAQSGSYTLPFTFDFYGQSFTQMGVSSSGYVWFGGGADPGLTPTSNLSTFSTAVIAPFLSSTASPNFSALYQVGGPSPSDASPLYIGDSAFRVTFGDPFGDGTAFQITVAKLEGGAGTVIEIDYGRITDGLDGTLLAGFTNGAGTSANFLTLFDPNHDIDLLHCGDARCGKLTDNEPDSYVGPGFSDTLSARFLTSYDNDPVLITKTVGAVDADGRAIFFVPGAASVPEASTWLLMIAGFAGLGFAQRRRALIARS